MVLSLWAKTEISVVHTLGYSIVKFTSTIFARIEISVSCHLGWHIGWTEIGHLSIIFLPSVEQDYLKHSGLLAPPCSSECFSIFKSLLGSLKYWANTTIKQVEIYRLSLHITPNYSLVNVFCWISQNWLGLSNALSPNLSNHIMIRKQKVPYQLKCIHE